MTAWADAALLATAILNVAILGSARLVRSVRRVALQGVALSLHALLAAGGVPEGRAILLALGNGALKGVVFPYLLIRTIRAAPARQEARPYVGFTLSVLFGAAFAVAGLLLASRLPLPPALRPPASDLAVPIAFASLFSGLFLIVARRHAVFQVLGYLMLEGGLYLFGTSLVRGAPFLVEMGVLLDAFVAVFIMGLALLHIGEDLDHHDTGRLAELKD